jgi:hypothetical protein
MSKPVISGYCRMRDGELVLNGETRFRAEGTTDEFIRQAAAAFQVQHPRFGKLDRLSKLGYTCCEILLQTLPHFRDYAPEEVALAFANASSSLDTDYRFQQTVSAVASPALFVYTLPNIVLAEIAIKNGFKGEQLFLVSDRPDARLLADTVAELLDQHPTRACVAGWVEILGESYHCTLFAVEQSRADDRHSMEFTINQIQQLFD